MPDERRRCDRARVEEFVVVVMSQGDAVGEVRDLSLHGMFIALAPLQPARGDEIVLQLNPAHARAAVELRARVRWTAAHGIGVELGDLGARERAVLQDLIVS